TMTELFNTHNAAQEAAAEAFLAKFKIGTRLGSEEIMEFAADHGKGRLAAALLVLNPKKCFDSVRRILNTGGSSRNLPEAKRFIIEAEDAKRGLYVVRPLADYTKGPPSTVRYTCPSCGANAWGKPELAIACIPCGARMVSREAVAEPRAVASVDFQTSQSM